MDPAQEFSELYRRQYDTVLHYALRRCDAETARDVTAETFLVAWRRRSEIPAEPGEELPWLYGVARRVLANAQRSRRRAERVTARLGQERGEKFSPDAASVFAEHTRLKHALASLSQRDQEALRLVGWEGLDLASAALAMGCSQSAMAVRLHRARRRLEHALGTEWDTREPSLASQSRPRTSNLEK